MLEDMASILRFDDEERARIRGRLSLLTVRRLQQESPRACVLVPLCHLARRPSVLFTKRSETVGTHKGQVSFPGGRMDPTDTDEIACALRELDEEPGISPSSGEILGMCHEAMSITGVRVTPVVGYLGDFPDLSMLKIAPAEIDVAFGLSVEELTGHREIRQLGPRKAPFFTAGPHPVWGLTAFILEEVLQQALGIALPPIE